MKKVCKTALFVVAILLLGFFSQQETKAGETSEKHYSRAYSVLSANVGNAKHRDVARSKLQSGPDEERVKKGIQDLKKPDILILIEASNKDQALRICNGTGESYFVPDRQPDRQYDFVCVKNDIVAKKDNGELDIKHEQMPGGNGNSVGYVEVGLKDEEGRKVRLFYAHFPSHFPKLPALWTTKEHKAHKDAFNWICENLKADIPCLIAGDLNNDFIRWKADSSSDIKKRVENLNLWIFNPLVSTAFQIPEGNTSSNYEPTHSPEQTVGWETTIDWVMSKFCVPPSRVPGWRLEIDPITGTIPNSFVTSPPDWWKDTGRLTFDHKPLFGKVVFFWEERIKPDILATYVAKGFEDAGFLELREDNTCLLASFGKWKLHGKKTRWLHRDGSYSETFQYTVIVMAEPLVSVEDEGEFERIIMAEPLRKRAGPGQELISLNAVLVGDIEDEIISNVRDSEERFIKDKKAALVRNSEGNLWSKYLYQDQEVKLSLEFKEDGAAHIIKTGKWRIKDDILAIQLFIGDKEILIKGRVKDNVIVMEDGLVWAKKKD